MISKDIEIKNLDPIHLLNLADVFKSLRGPSGKNGKNAKPPEILAVATYRGLATWAVHSRRGLLRGFSTNLLEDLPALVREQSADWAIVFDYSLLDSIRQKAATRVRPEMNYGEQALAFYDALREELGHGLKIHPPISLPEIKYGYIQAAMKAAIPGNRVVAAVVYADDERKDSSGLPIVTSSILRVNEKRELNLVATTDGLASPGLSIKDWRRDYHEINRLIEQKHGELFMALHLPENALGKIATAIRAKEPPSFLLDMHKREEIRVDPLPFRVGLLLKAGKLTGFFNR